MPEVTIAWQGGEPTLMGARLLPALGRARRAVPAAGAARGVHDPDERDAARRGVGGVLQGARLPRRRLDRRPARAARRVPREQGRQGLVRPGDARARLPPRRGRRVERADDDPRRQRRATGATSIASCATSAAHGSSSSSRSSSGSPRPTEDGTVPWTSWRDRPLYVQEGNRVTGRSVTAEQYGRFLIDVFEEWVRRDVGEVYVQMFDVALANWFGEPSEPLRPLGDVRARARARAHGRPLLVRPLRRARATSSGTSREKHMLELVSSPQQRQFGLDKRETLPRYCLECDVRFACHGGCPKDRFIETPDGEAGLNYLCAGYKAFFHHVDGRCDFMCERLRRDARRPRSSRSTRRGRARGRNDRACAPAASEAGTTPACAGLVLGSRHRGRPRRADRRRGRRNLASVERRAAVDRAALRRVADRR